jgi:hypothetical protein
MKRAPIARVCGPAPYKKRPVRLELQSRLKKICYIVLKVRPPQGEIMLAEENVATG